MLEPEMMMALEYLRGVAPEECRRLRAVGIRHTNQLLHMTSLVADRQTVSRRTGIPEPRLLELCHQCEMLEVSGMTRHVPVLRRLGIVTVKGLRARDAADLHARLLSATGLAGAPTLSEVQYWISQCRALDIVEEESGPPAARTESPSVSATTPEATRTAL